MESLKHRDYSEVFSPWIQAAVTTTVIGATAAGVFLIATRYLCQQVRTEWNTAHLQNRLDPFSKINSLIQPASSC